ncbi:phage tail tape measure protein [Pseudomonas syringae]|uniref:phage tail tape measure protein n=1 Tax=Pseudomonas syringae TaxID=317 RepID=UPI00067DD9D1|nr:phage tail tape measure protein [Pseudomonas syringae]
MTTIAELGLAVNSESVVQATGDLDKFVDSGKGAEDSAKRVESAWAKAVTGISQDTSQVVKELQLMNSRQEATAQLMVQLSQAVGKASASFNDASANAQKLAAAGTKVGESADQAKARMMALAVAATQAGDHQESLNRAYEATAGASATAQREQLNLLAATSRASTAARESAAAQEKAAASAQKASGATAEEAIALGKLLGQIDPTVAAMKRLDAAQDELSKFNATGMLPDGEFAKYTQKIDTARTDLNRFDEGMNKTGMTAKATAASLRGVPAQFTDIFTSIAAGQPITMVALQQGGQLKDMFGGIGPAAKALGGYVLGLINPFTLAAAAAGGLALAYHQGSKEADAYRLALITTGNAAGTTTTEMAAMAERIGATVGTTGEASSALAQLANSGKIASDSFEQIATAAISFEKAGGQAVSATVAEFAKIGDDPVKAIAALNEKYNFLTAAVYEQVRSLQEQGDKQGAAVIAEKAYADALQSRSNEIKTNLGSVERAWRDVASAAKIGWDSVLGIGRQSTAGPDLTKLKQELAYKTNLLGTGYEDDTTKERVKTLKAEIDVIEKRTKSEQETAKATGDTARTIREGTQAYEEYQKGVEANYTKSQKLNKALEDEQQRITKSRAAGYKITAEQEEAAYKAIRERSEYQEKADKKSPVNLTAYNDSQNALKAIVGEYDNSFKELDALQKAGLITQEQYSSQSAVLIRAEKDEVTAAYESEIAALEAAQGKKGTTAAQSIQLDQKIADARSAMVKAQQDADAKLNVLSINEQGRLDKQAAAIENYVQALNDQLNTTRQQLQLQAAGVGMGDEARKRLQDDIKIQQEYQDKLDKLLAQRNKDAISQEQYDQQTDAVRTALAERLQLQKDYYQQVEAAQSNWLNGATSAFASYAEEAQNVAGMTKSAFLNAFDGLEDVLVSFVTNGKASFKDFVNSILADIARIVIKTQIIGPLLSTLGLSSSSAGGGGGVFSSITGGGEGTSITSLISSAKSVIDVASSKFGESLINGWNSGGESLVDSLSGAFDGGASYVSDAISSAFTAGSATASVAAEATAASFSAGISESAAAIGSQFSAEIGGAALSYEAASAASANALSSTLGTLSTALSVIGTAYTVFTAFQDYGVEGGLTTAGFAAAGAAIGSVVPVIGTAIGAAIGAVIGSIASASWFGGPNYEQLVSSAEGSYSGGKFKNEGWYDGWKENKTRLGAGTDGKLMSYVQQFTSTLGMLYDALGDGSDVSAAVTMRRRETSGDWSNGMAATLDNGVQITALKQYGLDVEANLAAYYDDFMGTFLAQAIVSSESLPQYFKDQFQAYSTDWEVKADTVIAAIEGVFTRFNGVNTALSQINVASLKLNETGMVASDSILNMVASLADLDTESATAKEKVDALNELVNSYYSAFFSAGEQFDSLTNTLNGSFAGFGLELPDSKAAYRAMVEDIDVTTAAGQGMFATLMGLATAADSYYKTIAQRESDYRDAFYTEAERTALSLASVTQEFKDVSVTLPETRAGYRELVEAASKDSSAAGKKMYDTLMSLAGEAGSAYDILETKASAAAEATKALSDTLISDAMSAVQRAVSAEQKTLTDAYNARSASLNDMAATAQQSVTDLTNVSSSLESALKSLNGTSDDAVKMLRTQAQATLQNALATVRAGGSLAGMAGLDDALDVVSSNTTDLYSSLEDFNRDQGRTANVVAELNAVTGVQLTTEQKLLETVQDQIEEAKAQYDAQMEGLTAQLDLAQAQVDKLNGIDNSVLSVKDAIAGLSVAITAAMAAKTTASAATGSYSGTGAGGAPSASDLNSVYNSVLGRDVDPTGAAYWAGLLGSGAVTAAGLAAAIKADAVKNGEVPAFAMGGDHLGGLRLVGENGPELEVTGPSRIFNANQTAAMLNGGGSGATVAELREMRREMESNATYTSKLMKMVADGIDVLVNSGVQINGTVETKAVA